MKLSIQLFHPSTNSSLVIEDPDPRDLDKFVTEIKRSEDNAGVIFNFTVNLKFNKASRAFVRDAFEAEGIDAIVRIVIYEERPNLYTSVPVYTGELDLSDYDGSENEVTANVEKVSFDQKIINLIDEDVDIDATLSKLDVVIPETPTIDLEYHPKAILKALDGSPLDSNEFLQPGLAMFDAPACGTPGGCDRNRDATLFGNIETQDTTRNDLDNTFLQSWGWSQLSPQEVYRAFEAGVTDIDISINLKHRVTSNRQGGDYDIEGCGNNDLGRLEIKAFFEHRDEEDNIKTQVQMGSDWAIPACPGFDTFESAFERKTYQASDVVVELGDKFFVYYTVRIFGNYEQNFGASAFTVDHELGVQSVKEETFIRFTTKTEFPATISRSVLVYELANKLCQYISDQPVAFESSVLGRIDTEVPYPEDGPLSLLAYTDGNNLRGITNKKLIASFENLLQSLRAKRPIEWGFVTKDDGTRIIVIEDIDFFYNKEFEILRFERVTDPMVKARKDLYIKKIETGYPKIENIDQVNGVDEFNTLRRYSGPTVRGKGELELVSPYRSSGFEIEALRRLRETTEESRLDDEGFLTAVVRDGGGFRTEQAENYDVVNNIFDPDSAYNLSISPARTIKNWAPVLASSVIRSETKVFKWSYGELNYLMESQKTGGPLIIEDENIDVSDAEPFWYNEDYTFKTELTSDQFEIIENNPYGFITFQDWAGEELQGFLISCKFTRVSREAEFELRRVYRPPSNE